MITIARQPDEIAVSKKQIFLRRIKEVRHLIVALVIPRRFWYVYVLAISRFECSFSKRNDSHTGKLVTRLRNWLFGLSKFGPYPIKIRSLGIEIIAAAKAHGSGVLLCSTHSPLATFATQALDAADLTPDLIVGVALDKYGMYMAPGFPNIIPGVCPGPTSLLKVRTTLQKGGVAAILLDPDQGIRPLTPNPLRVAGKLNAIVCMYAVTLANDGFIEVRFESVPYPVCRDEKQVIANLAAIEANGDNNLRELDSC